MKMRNANPFLTGLDRICEKEEGKEDQGQSFSPHREKGQRSQLKTMGAN